MLFTEMFVSPAKNSVQCTDGQSDLPLVIDRFVKLEDCNKLVLKSFSSQESQLLCTCSLHCTFGGGGGNTIESSNL